MIKTLLPNSNVLPIAETEPKYRLAKVSEIATLSLVSLNLSIEPFKISKGKKSKKEVSPVIIFLV